MPAKSRPSAKLLVIVSGSVAASKATTALRRLREQGHQLQVISTNAALQFVSELSLANAAACEIATERSWFAAQPDAQHLQLAEAEAVVIVGASADLLARAALGRASDLASATLLSVRCPVLWVPAMNTKMWLHPATLRNVQTLREYGHYFLGPEVGPFATRGEGSGLGRMSEPEQIVERVAELLASTQEQDLAGLEVVVSAGPTREYLDPVRFISNPSSGKMGYAVAANAAQRGAKVKLVSGPVELKPPHGIEVLRVESALEMQQAVTEAAASAQIVVMTAAVADYRATEIKTQKEAKTAQQIQLELVPNPDILAQLGSQQNQAEHKGRVLVGFAMETHAGVERAAAKAKRKNADFILLNYPTHAGSAFGGNDNQVTLVWPSGEFTEWPRQSKVQVAGQLLDEALRLHTSKLERA